MSRPHHIHRYCQPAEKDPYRLPGVEGQVTLICMTEDCYEGLNRDIYPPEKIGPKLLVIGHPE